MTQDRPKTALRRVYFVFLFASFCASIFGHFLVRFWCHFGRLWGAQIGHFWHRFFDDFCMSFQDRPKSGQERPKSAQEPPKSVPRAPQSAHEGSEKPPKAPLRALGDHLGASEIEKSVFRKRSVARVTQDARWEPFFDDVGLLRANAEV